MSQCGGGGGGCKSPPLPSSQAALSACINCFCFELCIVVCGQKYIFCRAISEPNVLSVVHFVLVNVAGEIPGGLRQLTNLTKLDMGGNMLAG